MLLLQRGADCNVRVSERFGNTLLHICAQRNAVPMVRALIDHGAKLEPLNWVKQTPFEQALCQGHSEVVHLFLEAGIEPNKADRFGSTALMKSAAYGFRQIVSDLLGHGAAVNQKDIHLETALHKAVSAGHVTCCEALLGAGADVTAQAYGGWSPLHAAASLAVRRTTHELILLLLRHGANVNLQAADGHDPVRVALDNMRLATVRMLLEAGASTRRLKQHLTPKSGVSSEIRQHTNDPMDCGVWIWCAIQNTRSLQDLCHIAVRQTLGTKLPHKIRDLPIPTSVQEKLLYAKLEQLSYLFET